MIDGTSGCDGCGRQVAPTRKYAKYVKLEACTVTQSDGTTRPSLRPVFGPERDLCLPCFRSALAEDRKGALR